MGHPGSWWGESLSVLTHALKPVLNLDRPSAGLKVQLPPAKAGGFHASTSPSTKAEGVFSSPWVGRRPIGHFGRDDDFAAEDASFSRAAASPAPKGLITVTNARFTHRNLSRLTNIFMRYLTAPSEQGPLAQGLIEAFSTLKGNKNRRPLHHTAAAERSAVSSLRQLRVSSS